MLQVIVQSIPIQYMILACAIVLGINLLAFALMGIDKRKAKRHKHRIREAVLLALALIGGGFGILIGMVVFHHKTNAARHPAFVNGVPIILLVELLIMLLGVAYLT